MIHCSWSGVDRAAVAAAEATAAVPSVVLAGSLISPFDEVLALE